MNNIKCEFTCDCCESATHTDGSFVYCAKHAKQRSAWKRCRKLKPVEIRYIIANQAL